MPIVFDATFFDGTGDIGYSNYEQQSDYLLDERDFILANFDLTGIACLEVGCSDGKLTQLMRAAGVDWVGVDISDYIVARDKSGGFIQVGDVRGGLPFGTNQFRFCASIYNHECLETDVDRDAAIAEIRRVTHNSQGDFYIVTSLGSPSPHYVTTRAAWEAYILGFFPTAQFFDGTAFQPSVRTVIIRGN